MIFRSIRIGKCHKVPRPSLTSFSAKYSTGPTVEIPKRSPDSKLKSTLSDFLINTNSEIDAQQMVPSKPPAYLQSMEEEVVGQTQAPRTVYIETYGCQMNASDTEIVYAIMLKSGFIKADNETDADVVFLNTCAVRDNAEQKIWHRLDELKSRKNSRKKSERPLTVGVLGCMAERLKEKLLESEKLVDLVAGPDAYRDLPTLLSQVQSGKKAINVMLSQDETYADISPVRTSTNGVSAFVTIMRGCNNMCTYCIVPFTRGRERSRPVPSIINEVKQLSAEGYKEVMLLGQNVNSYNDLSEATSLRQASVVEGFKTVYKTPTVGHDFAYLVSQIADVDPEIRIRYTSPHPKDFPDSLLDVIASKPNVCNSIHIPAQSGSSNVLNSMRRGYTREAYLQLIRHIRSKIPDISLSSDFISGFCGETEEDHQQTLELLKEVKFDEAFMFAYSVREKTPAHRTLTDDVPEDVKKRRLREVIDTFHAVLAEKNEKEIGKTHLVLIEGAPRKSNPLAKQFKGRSDTNKKVVFTDELVADSSGTWHQLKPGDYVAVKINSSTGVTLIGTPIIKTTLVEWSQMQPKLS